MLISGPSLSVELIGAHMCFWVFMLFYVFKCTLMGIYMLICTSECSHVLLCDKMSSCVLPGANMCSELFICAIGVTHGCSYEYLASHVYNVYLKAIMDAHMCSEVLQNTDVLLSAHGCSYVLLGAHMHLWVLIRVYSFSYVNNMCLWVLICAQRF